MPRLSTEILAWYDVHARDMPWRVGPLARQSGQRPDPYAVWLSEVMLQQTTVAAVREYHNKFMLLWPNVADLAAAQDADVMAAWAGLGYYARARNLLKCAREIVATHTLLTLPGIGPYTAAAVSAIAFDQPSVVVDGNVERVMARLHDVHDPLPTSKPKLTALAAALTPQKRAGDYAQAVMDLGATICTPRNPACGICPWPDPPLKGAWKTHNSLARHTFTHFHLELTIQTITVENDAELQRGYFVDAAQFDPKSLPTAMRKVYTQIAATLRHD